MNNKLTTYALALACSVLGTEVHASWEKFDALCGSSRSRCQVRFDGEKMTMPGLTIYAEDVISWNMADNSVRKCSWGLFTGTICQNDEDQRFMIKYMGADGSRQLAQVAFINHKPARTFISTMNLWSGLQAGNLRTVVQGATRTAALDPASVEAFEDVTVSPNAKRKRASRIGLPDGTSIGSTTNGSTPASPYSNRAKQLQAQRRQCWSIYLKENPAMQQWADANPDLAANKKQNYDDC